MRSEELNGKMEFVRDGVFVMKKDIFTLDDKTCINYSSREQPQFLLLQPVDEHDTEVLDDEVAEIAHNTSKSFHFTSFAISDWNHELSPWDAPAVFGKATFGHGAKATLTWLEEKLLPSIKLRYHLPEQIPVILGGYSLAAFFALWSAYQSHSFTAIAAASPSVWFPHWLEFAQEHTPNVQGIYLSLGNREDKTRNPVMATVSNKIRAYASHLLDHDKISTVLEWNKGNHFQHTDQRCALAFRWFLKK